MRLYREQTCECIDRLVDLLGEETLIGELKSYFSSDTLSEFITDVVKEYDLEDSFRDMEDEDEKGVIWYENS